MQRRKISGGTRGHEGLRCLDTSVSIAETLRKHGLTFWDDLGGRLSAPATRIDPIADIIRRAAIKPG